MKKKLTPRERAFCMGYISCADAKKAARDAGYKKNPGMHAQGLLTRQDIRDEIARLCCFKKQIGTELARLGYERLAFGSISDAVSLLYLENPTKEELAGMDLYCVSEIKRPKDGSMEIKFFDRLKALEKLMQESEPKEQTVTSPVYDAILKGALALKGTGDKDEG